MRVISFFMMVALFSAANLFAQMPARPATKPEIFPAPVSVELTKGSFILPKSISLIIAPGTDQATEALVSKILRSAGVGQISSAKQLPATLDKAYIVVGAANAAIVRAALAKGGAVADTHPEGYTLTTSVLNGNTLITIAGHDADGLFHAAYTLQQLVQRSTIPGLVIQDYPAMPIRGTIEGFYGAPWSMETRAKHLCFLASIKANTYVYSPKDDPYARDRWREPYPANTLAALGKLAVAARQNHINFVYAISPGPSICYSNPADFKALEQKFEALRSIGIDNFYVALDDIEYAKWNCEDDRATFGLPSAKAAGEAQAKLLNAVQASLDAHNPKANPLIMVPTEYYDAKESPYKAALRKNLNPKIVVQWTGTDVVPPAIAVGDARAATKAFGRKTLLWDNYPVNDYAQTTGRLLLAPYTRREAGLSAQLTGILSNPMNQEAPSRAAVTGVAAFGWNDKAYDAERTWHYAAHVLAGGDAQATKALLTFFDTQHLAPTFGSQPWQQQAPQLKAVLDNVREAIASGDETASKQAIKNLMQHAAQFTNAADIIRAGTVDSAFAREARPWLDAMQLWGRALQLTAAGLDAGNDGSPLAGGYFAQAKKLAADAAAIRTIKGATRFDGLIKIADGVLDKFIADAPKMIALKESEATNQTSR